MIELIDLREVRSDCTELSELQAMLQQVVGHPFQFFRVSYGDELRLHLGDLRDESRPRGRGRTRGSYIVGARVSSWIVSSGPRHVLVTSDDGSVCHPETETAGRRVDIKTIESGGFITPGSIVTSVRADRAASGFSLRLRFGDGSTVFIRPALGSDEAEPTGEVGSPDADASEIPDWEILTPHERILKVGPRPRWSYLDSTRKRSG